MHHPISVINLFIQYVNLIMITRYPTHILQLYLIHHYYILPHLPFYHCQSLLCLSLGLNFASSTHNFHHVHLVPIGLYCISQISRPLHVYLTLIGFCFYSSVLCFYMYSLSVLVLARAVVHTGFLSVCECTKNIILSYRKCNITVKYS